MGPLVQLTRDLSEGVDDVVKDCSQRQKRCYWSQTESGLASGEKVPWPEMSKVEVSLPRSSPSTAL